MNAPVLRHGRVAGIEPGRFEAKRFAIRPPTLERYAIPLEQIILLAIVQGVTEFLPISSSGHLILVPLATGFQDQGLVTDVMVHLGSLLAILVYFRRDVARLVVGGLRLLSGRWTDDGRLALYILISTIPAIVFGLIVEKSGFLEAVRGPLIVACNMIVFGLVMLLADRLGPSLKSIEEMRFGPALLIGVAQAIAIIPGTSRSGITISAARALGFTRPEAARFSFLLGIPAIAGAGALVVSEAIESGAPISNAALATGGLTFFTALAAIALLMAVIRRFTMLPFVLYRLALGVLLLALIYAGVLQA